MPLPKPGVEWPPKTRLPVIDEVNDAARRWANKPLNDANKRSLPVASGIAQTSADLLFGEPLRARLQGDESQARLDTLLDEHGLANRLLEAAEVAAAMGGVYLRPVWDPEFQEEAFLTAVQPHYAVPEWRWDRLLAVTFWKELGRVDGEVYRHLERHERVSATEGVILHGLYVGREQDLGRQLSLDAHPTTAGLQDVTRVQGVPLVVRYVPNVKPNRWHPTSPEGRWDWQGAEDILDDANKTWESWVRDIRLAKARLVVPREYLRTGEYGMEAALGTGEASLPYFDVDQEVYEGLDITGQEREITATQFAIRTQEHERSLMAAMERVVDHAGYAPATFGLNIDGRAESGTALRVREGKTFRTTAKKARYFLPALRDVFQIMLSGRSTGNGLQVTLSEDLRPSLELRAPDVADPVETAQAVNLLRQAKAASTETLVRIAQPDLVGDELDAEVARLQDEMRQESAPLPFDIGDEE